MKEKTIATYTTKKFRLQLLELTEEKPTGLITLGGKYYKYEYLEISYEEYKKYTQKKYQVRLNRKIIDTSISEYTMRKLFAMYVQNQVLQLKIY